MRLNTCWMLKTNTTMKKGILLRVGIDSKTGKWNAPCSSDGSFCYVPIPGDGSDRGLCFDRFYSEFRPFAERFGVVWPSHLSGACHLDPDFSHLTYGDQGNRGQRIRKLLCPGDFIVFWAGLHSIDTQEKVCSIIGFYTVSFMVNAPEVGPMDWHRSAHTRYTAGDDDIIVFAKPEESGRLRKHLPIGKRRDRSQRVDSDLLKKWGDLCKQDGGDWDEGWIQMSGAPPIFRKPEKFLAWFRARRPQFVHANNI